MARGIGSPKGDAAHAARLARAAKALGRELRKMSLDPSFELKAGSPRRTYDTNGWWIEIGSWEQYPPVDLWLDAFLGGERHHFWFGFGSDAPRQIDSLIRTAPPAFQPVKRYVTRDTIMKQGRVQLKNRPSEKDITHPVSERYGGSYWFGMYDAGSHGSPDGLKLDSLRAASFISAVISAAADARSDLDFPKINGFEGRRKIQWHMSIERRSRLAWNCKVRDRFRCRVCGFHFEEHYGRTGQNFAEAHHTVPLSRLPGSTLRSVDDLITVCANCHRMLHKLDGKARDVKCLKAMLQNSAKRRL